MSDAGIRGRLIPALRLREIFSIHADRSGGIGVGFPVEYFVVSGRILLQGRVTAAGTIVLLRVTVDIVLLFLILRHHLLIAESLHRLVVLTLAWIGSAGVERERLGQVNAVVANVLVGGRIGLTL